MSAPAREVVADTTGIGDGTAVLDVCCGSGDFLALVRERGAHVAGIDAAEGMVALAQNAVRAAILDAAAPHRAADGSYLFTSTFRWVVGRC
ncbi:MAG: methyltransferase domain-containing protein [Pseudonocardiaceae bacterium]|nr:MAG: methyltransferase domain-containing protein [Pseudonocardiaceae bacterium]